MRLVSFLAPLVGLGALAGAASADVSSPAAEAPARRGCGTAQAVQEWMDRGRESGSSGAPSARRAAVAAGPALRGRTLYTENFAIHYSVNFESVHQVAWHPADSTLRRLRDSLHAAFAGADRGLRDSLVHDRLDSLGAPHPTYAQKAAIHFERAHAYYADTLDMRMPDSSASPYFARPPKGRFSVDIVDIDTFTGNNETYGLTYPPVGLYASSLLLDNDFLYNSSVNATTGVVSGAPITAMYNGQVLNDYSRDWEPGIAVTAAHEYYHAVQFKYTSHLLNDDYHAWYELSASAMEERLAPQVNDYFQYLRHVVPHTGTNSLLVTRSLATYGNAIFHMYLGHVLGPDFDVTLWERLRNNGNKLPNALLTAFGSEARWDSLYTGYAASIAISGRPGAATSPLAFSPDQGQWPQAPFDTAQARGETSFSMQPLTFRLIRPAGSGVTWTSLPGMRGGWRLTETGANYAARYLSDSVLPVTAGAFAVTAANASPSQTRLLKLARASEGVSAYPNPARAGTGSMAFNADGQTPGAFLTVVSESGKRVARIALGASEAAWRWNLRDEAGGNVPPGVYYYGAAGQAPKTLLLLP